MQETYKLVHLSRQELLGETYNRYGKKLYSYAVKSWTLNEDEAWNLIYKTLYKIVDTHENYAFGSEEKFASFVFRIFINYLRNHYRDEKRKANDHQTVRIELSALKHSTTAVMTETAVNPKLAVLNEELDKMEDWQRILLLMRSEGMAYSEIAKYVDKPENQLKVYYQRLKEHITKKLHERI